MRERRFMLADCKNFYASCHRVFRPELRRTPIVVLSNNDGCVIARSQEAKPYVAMGEPFHQVKHKLRRHGIVAFSSTYALYGDMSERVMTVIEGMVPAVEVYSIDESFADVTGVTGSLEQLGRDMRMRVLSCTGIPVGVGIGSTKTLAKMANHSAKRWEAQTGGVVDLSEPERRDKVLRVTPVADVWGVGGRMTAHLLGLGIKTAFDLAQADPWMLRQKFSVVIERTARELRGVPCLELEDVAPPKQEICCSRAFGERLVDLAPIREAVSTYAARACEKLRAQGSVCRRVRVAIRTGMFDPDEPKFSKGIVCELPHPTDDTRLIIHYAQAALGLVYREGFAYAKAEVMLLDLCQRGEYTDDLFAQVQAPVSERVMTVLDSVNAKWGRGTLRPGRVPAEPEWGMKQQFVSPHYTTRMDQLWRVSCR